MADSSEPEELLRGAADYGAAVLAGASAAWDENLQASGLDPRTYAMVSLAALVASGADPASYGFQVQRAIEAGVIGDELVSLLVALNPTVGNVRTVAAAMAIADALGIEVASGLDDDS